MSYFKPHPVNSRTCGNCGYSRDAHSTSIALTELICPSTNYFHSGGGDLCTVRGCSEQLHGNDNSCPASAKHTEA